jgi:serine protease
MKLARWLLVGLGGALVAAGCGDPPQAGASDRVLDTAAPDAPLEGRVLVRFRDDGLRKRLDAQALSARLLQNRLHIEQLGGRLVRQLGSVNAVAADLTADQVEVLRSDPRVLLVEEDPVRQPFLPVATAAFTPSAETVPYGIGMVQADQLSDAGIANRKICIVDSGYDGTHPDLRPAPGTSVTGDDDNGLGADTGDWFHDGHGHGTHVAGTISALRGNDIGVVGVTGSDAVGLHVVKVFGNDGLWAYGSDLVVAVEQCIAAGANVISMSLGGGMSSATEQAAFDAALAQGVLPIAAAGNSGGTNLSFPASYDSVMSVAAVDSTRTVGWFSQRNAQVEIAAPGVAVVSTLPGDRYEAWDGTSMATPHVSGVAALVWSHFPDCSAAAIRNALTRSAQDLGDAGRDWSYGFGLVQAVAAFDYLATHGCTIPDPPPPPEFEELRNGVPVTGMSGASRSERIFVIDVPAGAANLSLNLSGGSGDADLYVRAGAVPDSTFDCASTSGSSFDSCFFAAPVEGRYYVKVLGFTAYADVSLVGTYVTEGCTTRTFTATGLPLGIPDNSATGVSTMVTSDREGTIGSVQVTASMTHTFRGDLVVTLVGPSGESHVLSRRAGGPADNLFIDMDFTAAFAGSPAAGDFQLQVQDRARLDVGTLDGFQVTITPNCQ